MRLLSTFSTLSLKKRIIYAFVAVVMVCSLLSAIVYSVFLVNNLKKSTKEKIQETLKVVNSKGDDLARNLETYMDSISKDQGFGQVLSLDSSFGIQNRINELSEQSHADVVVFIPKPIQYVQIKDEIFSNLNPGNDSIKIEIKKWVLEHDFLENMENQAVKGWIEFEKQPIVFAAKRITYFGTNMGVIFLAKKSSSEFAHDLSKAGGVEIAILSKSNKTLSSSFEKTDGLEKYTSEVPVDLIESQLLENVKVNVESYTALVSPIEGHDKKPVGKVVLFVSNASIRDAQAKTLYSATIVAFLAALFSVVIGFFIANAISRPLQDMTDSIVEISKKEDLSIRVSSNSGAEIGILTQAFNKLLEQLQVTTEKLSASEKRMKEELVMASTVQEMLFPAKSEKFQGLELASYIETSTETGGDWFGYYETTNTGKIPILIGDVTGHGMPAALITAITNGFFQGIFGSNNFHGTGEMLKRLNKILIESTQKNLLMTFFASIYDPQTRKIKYANAGHLRPFICKANADGVLSVTVLASDPGKRLGEDLEVSYSEQELQLNIGDTIVWYTDGILDCPNLEGESFGKRRFINALKKYAGLSAFEAVTGVVADFQAFVGGAPKIDDITIVIGRVT